MAAAEEELGRQQREWQARERQLEAASSAAAMEVGGRGCMGSALLFSCLFPVGFCLAGHSCPALCILAMSQGPLTGPLTKTWWRLKKKGNSIYWFGSKPSTLPVVRPLFPHPAWPLRTQLAELRRAVSELGRERDRLLEEKQARERAAQQAALAVKAAKRWA